MKNVLKNVIMCVISGFATQVGMSLAQNMFLKINDFNDKKHEKSIGF